MTLRKVWADSRYLARQTIALTVLIGLGIMLFVGLYQAYQNIGLTYDTIYANTHFADAAILMRRAPEGLIQRVGAIPHVVQAVGRVVKDGTIIQRGRKRERVAGRFMGLPVGRRPIINDLWITEGRYISRADEAVLEHQFAHETGYEVGDMIKCSYLGREREFTLVGFAISPEYVYPVPSKHSMFVARGTFGVVFIDEERARNWLGVGRQITEIHAVIEPGHRDDVLSKMEGLARPHGLETSYLRKDQPSNYVLTLDKEGWRTMSVFFPFLFLSSAGLSLYGALARIVRLQVTTIGMLKACGFSRWQILGQYTAQGLLITLAGAIPGAIFGHMLSIGVSNLYMNELRLPFFIKVAHADTLLGGLTLAAVTGLVAALLPARMAGRLPPAVAMRGDVESPGGRRLQRGLVRAIRLARVVWLIPVRGVFRRASRTLLAMGGIAGGAIIIITTLGMHVSTMGAIDEYLTGTRKYEIDLSFTHPDGLSLAAAGAALPGGRSMARSTSVPVRIRSSRGESEMVLMGIEPGQQLLQVRAVDGEMIAVRPDSIWLPKLTLTRLGVEAGDPVQVEWIQSSRRWSVERTMRVAGAVEVSMGSSAYGEYADVRRHFTDKVYPEGSYGAFVDCDPSQTEALKHLFERSDEVAMVSTTKDAKEEIDEQMAMIFVFIAILLSFGGVLAGSAIHSVGSVSILERTRELATLRSLGFSARQTGALVALELLVLSSLGLVVGLPMGATLNTLFLESFSTETMSFRAVLPIWVHLVTVCTVLLLVAVSSHVANRRLAAMDLSQATKARE